MIQDILNLSRGEILKLAIACVGVMAILFHILPKSKNKEKTTGFICEILNLIKGIFKK